jgi:hypothetical protein
MRNAELTAAFSGPKTRSAALVAALLFGVVGSGLPGTGFGMAKAAETCSADDFSLEVDQAGEALRTFNTSVTPTLQKRLRQLKVAKGWSDADAENLSRDYLYDARIAGLDNKANDLLSKLDELGSAGETGSADCSKLNELKATGAELLAVMKAKSAYTLAKIDDELAGKQGGKKADRESASLATRLPDVSKRDLVAVPSDVRETEPRPSPAKAAAEPSKGKTVTKQPAPAAPAPSGSWNAVTQPAPQSPPGTQELAELDYGPSGEGQVLAPPPGAFAGPEEGYTLGEIRDATKGFFGTISTNLATVIEYAFGQWGQPTGYVLGKEGGGAFLAGVRYGSGTLFMRSGQQRKVYWHGPSLGYDFGAEGSRTLYLIYSLKHPNDLYRSYTGVDGSAYLIGGVGVTLLKGGPVVLAPIRAGIGLRLGANIGYLRFTPKQTWNPF